MNLRDWDVILINTSAGKDSQAMMTMVCERALNEGVLDRVIAVHCDLGRVEWKGTRELAIEQAEAHGIPIRVVSRPQGDLLEQVEARGMWPSSEQRYCTSDQKRGQVEKVITALVNDELWNIDRRNELELHGKRIRVLNCMGLRAEESTARSKKNPLEINSRASNGKREVWNWLPIFRYTRDQVWATIRESGVRHHPAYDLGMPRLSCVFCIFATKPALMLAGKHNPELLEEYVAVEQRIGHSFQPKMKIAEVRDALARGEEPGVITTWEM